VPRTADTRVIVFARAPRPGQAKTRLVPLLGAQGAAALQAKLVKHALKTALAAAVGPVELCCAPDAKDPFLRSCGARYRVALAVQAAGDLGARMHAALARALAAQPRAVLIGSDCPALGARHLRQAAAALAAGEPAVLAPAEDGGYALIGLARSDPRLFDGIAWGGATVMEDTRARLRALGWRWRELETLWDVDRPEDYARLTASGLLGAPPPAA
jgi:rSAM/selenodomain-associated transferase 1